MIKDISTWVVQNLTWIVIATIALIFLQPLIEEQRTIVYVLFFESLAIGLSLLNVWLISKFAFIQAIVYGTDSKLSSTEQHSFVKMIGNVWIAVHLLVGIVVLGIYIAQFKM